MADWNTLWTPASEDRRMEGDRHSLSASSRYRLEELGSRGQGLRIAHSEGSSGQQPQ